MPILQDALTRLELRPDLGGAIANWALRDGGAPLLRHADEQALAAGTPRRLGCFALVPWSNRIAKGGFANPSGWLDLQPPPGEALPIHGSAWHQAWTLLAHDPGSALLVLDSAEPFPYRAEQRLSLRDGCLSLSLQVEHRGADAAWYGLGLHPYFPRTAATRLEIGAEAVWLCGDDRLPNELAPLPPAWDFARERTLPDSAVDNAFAGWNGRCRIVQPDLGYVLECQASHCGHYMLFCPSGRDFFCVEPVSHPPNAHHLPGRPGLRLLKPGQRLRLDWHMTCRPLAARP